MVSSLVCLASLLLPDETSSHGCEIYNEGNPGHLGRQIWRRVATTSQVNPRRRERTHVQGRLLRAAHHCPPAAVAAAPR
jgi:hypothetical protein